MNFFNELKILSPNKEFSLIEAPILKNGVTIGYHSTFLKNDIVTSCGGTAENKSLARRIAVAECFERELYFNLSKCQEQSSLFKLNFDNSTTGFAAGFNRVFTAFRSLCEGVEHWAWSKWIDDHFFIPRVSHANFKFSILSQHFLETFSDHLFYQVPISTYLRNQKIDLQFSIFLGITSDGVFPGSRVSSNQDELWEHAIVEAYRNFVNYSFLKSNLDYNREKLNTIAQRCLYFGNRKNEAFGQIQKATKPRFPSPKISLHREYITDIERIFLFRTLCSGYETWEVGNQERFVY